MSIFLFLVILLVLVVAHELGHFTLAKRFGVRVDEFAVGFPPRLFGIKKGGTLYSFNALPLGGYVKIFGESYEEASEEDKRGHFAHKPRSIQALIISGGILANFLLAWGLLSLGFMIGTPLSMEHKEYAPYAKDVSLTITGIKEGAPADRAGIMAGDRILEIGTANDNPSGTPLTPESERVTYLTPEAVQQFIGTHGGRKLAIILGRDGGRKTLFVTPEESVSFEKPIIGVSLDEIGIVRLPFFKSILEGGKQTYIFTRETIFGFIQFFGGIFKGEGSIEAITGPVGIVNLVGEAEKFGFAYLLSFTALISVNLAVINFIPFPALDGGRLLFIIIEAIRRKAIKPKVVNVVNAIGFILLITLMVVVTWNDITKLLG